MDYRRLLLKYINHAGNREGTTFIDEIERKQSTVYFTPEEKAELIAMQFEEL